MQVSQTIADSSAASYNASSADVRPVDLSRIPPNGPFVAYVGNFPFETEEHHLATFFEGLNIVHIKVVFDVLTERPKGFAYITFGDRVSLENATTVNGAEFMGRALRIDVAEQRETSGRYGSSAGGSGSDRYGSRDAQENIVFSRDEFGKSELLTARSAAAPRRDFHAAAGGFAAASDPLLDDKISEWRGGRAAGAPAVGAEKAQSAAYKKFVPQPPPKPSQPRRNPFGEAKPVEDALHKQFKEAAGASEADKKQQQPPSLTPQASEKKQ